MILYSDHNLVYDVRQQIRQSASELLLKNLDVILIRNNQRVEEIPRLKILWRYH